MHRAGEDPLPRLVGEHELERVGALGRGVLGVRVVDVVAGAVGEHRVDEVGLDLGRLRAVAGEAAGVAAGRLVVEVPADPAVLDVAVDQQRRREHRVRVGARRAATTPYSVSIPHTFGTATASVTRSALDSPLRATCGPSRDWTHLPSYRYWPVVTRSIWRPPCASSPSARIVRTYTMRSPFLPEIFAQSSGFVVFGRSSCSRNSC